MMARDAVMIVDLTFIFFILSFYDKNSRTMNTYCTHSEFYFKALIKGISYEIDSHGEPMKRPAACTRLQICNLPPLELPTAVDNFVYVRITNIEGMKKFFGTLERNRLLLNDLQKILNDLESTNCKSLFDPAPGEIVLVKIGERFVRGCVVCKTHFMTCTIYLIDSGFTMEIGLDQLYVIDEELLKIPPQAFLMLLDVDIDEPLISNDELNELVKDTLVAFRLKYVSENGEAFVGALIMRNQNGEICDLKDILLEGFDAASISHENDETAVYVKEMQDASICFTPDYAPLSDKDNLSQHASADFEEDVRSVISYSSDTEKQLISVGSCWRAIRIPTENSRPGLFYLHFLDGQTDFEDLRIFSASLFGKYNDTWHKLLEIPDLMHDTKDDVEFVQISNIVKSHGALFYGGNQVNAEMKNRLKAAFACRLAYCAPKPFNNNRYSIEAKSYFNGNLLTNQIFDVYIVRILRTYVLEVEILLPGGESIFDKLCELSFAQHRWSWKMPSYDFESINKEQLVQRTDDEDDVHLTFTIQIENKRNDLIEFQKHLKPSRRILCNPEIGDICIVDCESQLFRCEIVDIIDENKSFVISYVDYGEEQELSADFLYGVDNQEEIVFETPIFGIKCRLEEIYPVGRGLDIQGDTWSRTALKLINSVVPLNKQFKAFIGPPDLDNVHPIRIIEETLMYNDLATTLVLNDLAMYRHCNYSSTIDLSSMEDLEIQYLSIEDGILYGIPNIFEIWLKDCQYYLEKTQICDMKAYKKDDTRDTMGIILYEDKYRRVTKMYKENKELGEVKSKYFLIDEGRTIEFCGDSEISTMITFSKLEDRQAAFFLRTCPALAVGFILKNEKLSTNLEELLKNRCSREKNVHLKACTTSREKNNLYSVADIIFVDGTSLVNLLDYGAEVFVANSLLPTSKLLPIDTNNANNASEDNGQWENGSNVCCDGFFSNVDFFKEHEIVEKEIDDDLGAF
ncbi:Maternal protein tudor [Dirofilaria immitis]